MATAQSQTVSSTQPRTMEELLAQSTQELVVPKKGSTVTGKVTSVARRTITVDFGAKTEGAVSGKEYDFASEFVKDLKVGDDVTAIVVAAENERGQIALSLKNAAADAKWDYFKEALDKELIMEAKGLEVNRGGLVVLVNGVRGFVPSSQFGRQFVGKFQQLKGASFKVRAIEVEREGNRLIFSERHVSEAKELAAKEQALDNVKAGEVYEGVVSGVMHFGLFVTVEVPFTSSLAALVIPEVAAEVSAEVPAVDAETTEAAPVAAEAPAEKKATKKKAKAAAEEAVAEPAAESAKTDTVGYVEGLVHISEISWEKVGHPKDYHKVGDRLKVKVLGVDDKTGKLNLSIKQLLGDPWVGIEDRYPIGTTFTGRVTRIESFGVFINAEPGVDGLIHNTKLDPARELRSGEEVTVTVESVSEEQRRMSLSVVLTEVPIDYK